MTDTLHGEPGALRRLQDEKLGHGIALCRRDHPWYREAWQGVDPDAVQGIADLRRLPLTPQSALMETPRLFRPDCPDLPVPEHALRQVVHATGSSGDPTPTCKTTWDCHGYRRLNRRVAEIAGITDRDATANLCPLTAASMGAFMRSSTLAYATASAKGSSGRWRATSNSSGRRAC